MAKFYVVSTPIGNLEDVTLRALRILKEVDFVICEDTRVTKKLLDHYAIKKSLLSFNAHGTLGQIEKIISLLKEGKNLALVTDAGTPSISDPGSYIVSLIREQFDSKEVNIVSVPGASALTAALSISGVPSSEFLFLGFIPTKKGRTKTLKKIVESEMPVVFFESTHRIIKLMDEIAGLLPQLPIFVLKELTKIHENVFYGRPADIKNIIEKERALSKGEFVVIIPPKKL